MSDFDPYYKWLGIPPEEQPPTYYRLLGIQTLEQNTEVIEAAANRQMAYLQELSGGDDHIDEAQRLLGEVAKARVCLLSVESKARYDAELTNTLDSLPEAADESTAAAGPALDSIEMANGGRGQRRQPGGGSRKSTPGRGRSTRAKKGGTGKSSGGRGNSSSDLAIKIGALVGTAIVVLVVGILLLGGGGKKSSSKRSAQGDKDTKSSPNSPGTDRLRNQDRRDSKNADATFDRFNQRASESAGNKPVAAKPTASTRPAPKAKPPVSPTNNASEDAATTPIEPRINTDTDTDTEELSDVEQAEALLKSRGLEEGFNSEWEHAELTAAYDQAKSANGSQGIAGGGDDFEAEFIRQKRNYFEILKAFYKQTNYSQHPSADPAAREAAAYLNSVGQRPKHPELLQFTLENGAVVEFQVPSDIPAISLREKVQSETASQSTSPTDSKAADEIAVVLQAQYSALEADAEIQSALETVGGTLAKAPMVLGNSSEANSRPVSIPTTEADLKPETAASDPAENNENTTASSAKKDTPPEPSVSYEELEEQLTAVEKETRLALGKFNKGAKEYLKKKKELVKRIKTGDSMIAKRSKFQDSLPDGEPKTKFGQETEAKYVKPLTELKTQLQNLAKPDAVPLEDKLKQSEKLIEQLKKTSGYAEGPKSVDSLAEKIAKYRRGFEVQQTKMAK